MIFGTDAARIALGGEAAWVHASMFFVCWLSVPTPSAMHSTWLRNYARALHSSFRSCVCGVADAHAVALFIRRGS